MSDIVDPRIRALIADYARLTGARTEELSDDLLRLNVTDATAFGGRKEFMLAFSLDAVERHPRAELPVVGGAFWNSLIEAMRSHGQRTVTGLLPVNVRTEAETPDVEVKDAVSTLKDRAREVRRIARLTVKVTVAAGTSVHEEVVQSDVVDLANAQTLPPDVAALYDAATGDDHDELGPLSKVLDADRLVPALIRGLEERTAARVATLRAESERELAAELRRIDVYFEAMKNETIAQYGLGSTAVRTVEHEHERRRGEEIRRHGVRVEVHPLQVLERSVLAEAVAWELVSPKGRRGSLTAQRYLTGHGNWGIRCAACHKPPVSLVVCRAGHVVGEECSASCTVCAEHFCIEHGYEGCHVDARPVCAEHGATCWSCDRTYCSDHTAACAEGHEACVQCMVACASCQRTICRKHAITTHEGAPLGARLLCQNCVVYCEGSTNEPVGRDEAAQCGTCDRHICRSHQVKCVVDQKPHCSKHLRRADKSRRFICEQHIAACDHEANDIVFAADEVRPCVECGKRGCDSHAAQCHEDQRWHCWEHMVRLWDHAGAAACGVHHTVCHIDGRTFSLAGTEPCDACARTACRTHITRCSWCGGRVCVNHESPDGRCATCVSLKPAEDLPDDILRAVGRAAADVRPKERLAARDAGRFVVQLDLGWTRKLVIVVPHGTGEATRTVRHSLFGSTGLLK